MNYDLRRKFWSITRLKTSRISLNLKIDAYPLNCSWWGYLMMKIYCRNTYLWHCVLFFSPEPYGHYFDEKERKSDFSSRSEATLSRITRGAVKSYSRMSQIGYNCSFIEKAFLCVFFGHTLNMHSRQFLVQSPIRRGTCRAN